MPDLVTRADVLASMARTEADFTTEALLALDLIIEGIEADLQAYLRRPLVETTIEDEAVKVNSRGQVYFAQTPVRSIAAFSIDGTAVTSNSWTARAWGLDGLSYVHLASPLQTDPVLLASYVAGLPGEDASTPFGRKARATILRAVKRDFNQDIRLDASGLARLSVEGTNYEFRGGVNAGAGGLTDDEKVQFSQWRRRIVRAG